MPDAVDEDEFWRDYHLVVFHVWNGDGGDGSIGDNRLTGHHPVRVQPDIPVGVCASLCASLCNFNTSNSIKNCIFVFVILTGNFLHTGKRLALFLTDESGQFGVTGIMFNRLCLAISGSAHTIAKREQLNLIRHARPSRADQ